MKSIGFASVFVTFLICSFVEVIAYIPSLVYHNCPLISVSLNKANPLSRIVNGHKAVNYQFPWHCSLHITKTSSEQKTYCGGALIAPYFVLTAASCVRNASSIQVDIGSIVFAPPYETHFSTQYQIYPQFDEQYKNHNIAVIRLATSVTFTINIRAILLPRMSEQNDTFESLNTYVSGFGVSEAGSNYLSNDLLFALKQVKSNEICRQSFASGYMGSSFMCASGRNGTTESICTGDHGGALVAHIDGSWVLVGVASVVPPNGCTGLTPAGYTRAGYYLDWIHYLTAIVPRP